MNNFLKGFVCLKLEKLWRNTCLYEVFQHTSFETLDLDTDCKFLDCILQGWLEFAAVFVQLWGYLFIDYITTVGV